VPSLAQVSQFGQTPNRDKDGLIVFDYVNCK